MDYPININTIRNISNHKSEISDTEIIIRDINGKIQLSAIKGKNFAKYSSRDVQKIIWYKDLERDELENIKRIYEKAGYIVKFTYDHYSYHFYITW